MHERSSSHRCRGILVFSTQSRSAAGECGLKKMYILYSCWNDRIFACPKVFNQHPVDMFHLSKLQELQWLRFANEVRSSPKVFTPVRGQNVALHLGEDVLSKLTMPVLFLWGEDDPNGGAAIARTFTPRLPNADLVIVPGAEHAPWLDDLDTCVSHSRAFLLS